MKDDDTVMSSDTIYSSEDGNNKGQQIDWSCCPIYDWHKGVPFYQEEQQRRKSDTGDKWWDKKRDYSWGKGCSKAKMDIVMANPMAFWGQRQN